MVSTKSTLRPERAAQSISNYFINHLHNSSIDDILKILRFMKLEPCFIIESIPIYDLEISQYNKNFLSLKSKKNTKYDLLYSMYDEANVNRDFASNYYNFIKRWGLIEINYDNLHLAQDFIKKMNNDNQILLDNMTGSIIRMEKRAPLFMRRISLRNNRSTFQLHNASSGQLYILFLSLFVNTFKNKKSLKQKTLLIDEPENSLHPKWQSNYIDMLMNIISYNDIKIIIATHSPLIASGNPQLSKLYKLENNQQKPLDGLNEQFSIEQTYYKYFDILTPRNRYLSELCNQLLNSYINSERSYDDTLKTLEMLRNMVSEKNQRDFMNSILKLLEELKKSEI